MIFCLILLYLCGVYFYLRWLTKKYFLTIDKTPPELCSQLKTLDEIRNQYQDRSEINILVLTGGGVRGLIPLLVLSKIEELTGKKTGELFDFMAGTSTGSVNCGIMAVADDDGNNRYSAQNIVDNYMDNIRMMFSAPWYHQFLTLFGIFGPRYLPEGKLSVLNGYFANSRLANVATNILVPVYDVVENSLKIIRNWAPSGKTLHSNYLLTDLIHGASNPPMLFSPQSFTIDGEKKIFIDPGVVLNNPAEIALMNAWFMFPNKKIRLVLIGNGGNDVMKYDHQHIAEFGAYGLFQYLLNSPVINSKLSTDLVYEYIHEANDYGLDVEFVEINSDGAQGLLVGDTSDSNMARIRQFADKVLMENHNKIIELKHNLELRI